MAQAIQGKIQILSIGQCFGKIFSVGVAFVQHIRFVIGQPAQAQMVAPDIMGDLPNEMVQLIDLA